MSSTPETTVPTPAANADHNSPSPEKAAQRKKLLKLFAIALLLTVVGYGIYYWLILSHFEDTDDAYVGGDMVYVNAQVGGTVTNISASENQAVKVGDTLLTMDPADNQVALAETEARLGEAVRQTQQQYGSVKEAQAALTQRQTEVQRAQGDYQRRQKLAGTEAISNEELEHARLAVQAAQAAVVVADRQLGKARSSVSGTTTTNHPSVLRARAAYVQANLATQRGALIAPVSGTVAKRTVQVGQRVSAGASLLAIVPLSTVWVDANFKEPQLRHIRVGQPVEVHADVYGNDVTYHGKVASISAGTGGAFSLLPPQNATGNWIKVVQRIPVRIALDAAELKEHPLAIGMSTSVNIDIKKQGDASTTTTSQVAVTPNANQNTKIFDQQLAKANEQADAIIRREISNELNRAVNSNPAQ